MTGTAKFGAIGYAPKTAIGQGNPEALKYGKMWEIPEYRHRCLGEELAQAFLAQAKPRPGAHVIDFGCGTGRGSLMLAILGRLRVTMIDFVRNSLDEEVRQALTTQKDMLQFVKADLEQKIPVMAEYGYCTEVMEHIPPEKVDQVLDNILLSARHVFFSIALVPDVMGARIGETLHLTVQPYEWWLQKFNDRQCAIHYAAQVMQHALFYVSAWRSGPEIVNTGVLNVEDEEVRNNVRHNIQQGWEQVRPHPSNNQDVAIIGGGWTLTRYEKDIKRLKAEGVSIVTLNGAYNWCMERDIMPVTQIVVDARAINKNFTKPVREDCLYLMASQCHPSLFEGLPKERTILWHTHPKLVEDILNEHYPAWYSIPGGSTVLLRAIPLLRMLGFRRFHLFGCDSCLGPNEEHHAYPQSWNDGKRVIPVNVEWGGRIFLCHPWMNAQAQEFIDLIRFMGDQIELEVYGDGLLRHILETAATLQDEEDQRDTYRVE